MNELNIDYSKMAIRERICLVEKICIIHPLFKGTLDKIRECHECSKYSAEPKCILITGPSGAGKTTISRHYVSQFPRQTSEEGTIIPVLFSTISVPATVKNVASGLLYSMGDPMAHKGTTYNKTLRLYKLIKYCAVKLIILDEFQHFIDRDSDKVLQVVSDWLKVLLDETNIPMILIGMPKSVEILLANEQLQRRFSTRKELSPFSYKTPEQQDDFRKFLKILESKLPLMEQSYLYAADTSFRFFFATNGIISKVMKIVRKATVLALEQKLEKLTMDILAQAYDYEIASKEFIVENPFNENIDKLLNSSNKETPQTVKATNRRIKAKKKEENISNILSIS
ncbi:MAG: TniB family NTP-binding protein [Nitrospinae bacterium]|nr:TniB family NTP-binding protein [Nitrospinota bacterium]